MSTMNELGFQSIIGSTTQLSSGDGAEPHEAEDLLRSLVNQVKCLHMASTVVDVQYSLMFHRHNY